MGKVLRVFKIRSLLQYVQAIKPINQNKDSPSSGKVVFLSVQNHTGRMQVMK